MICSMCFMSVILVSVFVVLKPERLLTFFSYLYYSLADAKKATSR